MAMNNSNSSSLHAAIRRQELDRAIEFVESIEADAANHFLLNFFAPRGFGRTALLQQIWERYERILPASFVHVDSFCKENGTFALCDLLIQIIRELDFRLPKRITQVPSDYERSNDENWLAELVTNLVSSAAGIEKVVLLLLDDYDAQPVEISRWFESTILSPFVKTRKVAVILSSEFELRFAERLDLRMRLESYELSSVSTEAISHSFPKYGWIAPEIHRITGGLPTLTQGLIQQLEASEVTTAADFRSHEQELVRRYYRSYVSQTMFRGIAPDVRETILVLALLRRFDVKVLGGILPKALPKYYQGLGTADYLDLIERLGSWVQWRMQGGYSLNPAFWTMLQGYILTEKPKLYRQVNSAAIILYRDLLKDEYREHYLVELLYHRLTLLKLKKQISLSHLQEEIGDELLQYLNSDATASIQEADLDSLRNCLIKDADLKDYISEDVLSTIQRLIDAKANGHRVISFNAKGKSA